MDIRKADSKGRLTGFDPGVHYRFENLGSVRKAYRVTMLDELVDLSNMPEAAPEAVQDYLRRFGIDPKDILREDCMEEGYTSFVRDENGDRIPDYGMYRTVRKPWPKGFNWDEFVGLVVESS